MQTADALGRKYRIHAALGIDGSARRILDLVNWPAGREPVLLVGHQPRAGPAGGAAVHGVEADWPIRKGAAWWIAQRERNGQPQVYVKAVMSPELCGK